MGKNLDLLGERNQLFLIVLHRRETEENKSEGVSSTTCNEGPSPPCLPGDPEKPATSEPSQDASTITLAPNSEVPQLCVPPVALVSLEYPEPLPNKSVLSEARAKTFSNLPGTPDPVLCVTQETDKTKEGFLTLRLYHC